MNELVTDLKLRIERLSSLEGSFEAIREMALGHQKEIVSTMMGTLEDLINKYYNAMMGHPYFVRLRLERDEKDPLIYSIKGSSSDLTQSTFVSTRFSNTQMNVVALSIFLASNVKMSGNLNLTIMDDPSQSMDDEHRKALAKAITELSRDKQIILGVQDTEMKAALNAECEKCQTYKFNLWDPSGLRIE